MSAYAPLLKTPTVEKNSNTPWQGASKLWGFYFGINKKSTKSQIEEQLMKNEKRYAAYV